MARPLRIEFLGAWYHVMNRGAGKQVLFQSSEDFHYFLKLLSEIQDTYKIEIHAYCLMNNHYHLLIRTPYGMLSRSIRYLNGMYAKYFNKINNRDGSIFKGRYKAILIDADNYFLIVSRYIHLNPIEARVVDKLEKYNWSSFQFYINPKLKPDWLSCNETLNRFNNNSSNYIEFVIEGINAKEFYQPNKTIATILGSDKFIENMKKNYKLNGDLEEISDYKKIEKGQLPSVEEIIITVSKYFTISYNDIINSFNKNKYIIARKIAIYLSTKYSGQTQEAISKVFFGISDKGVSKIKNRMEIELRFNHELSKILNEIIQLINK